MFSNSARNAKDGSQSLGPVLGNTKGQTQEVESCYHLQGVEVVASSQELIGTGLGQTARARHGAEEENSQSGSEG